MSQAIHSIELAWKEFSINMDKVEAHLRANLSSAYCGNSAGAKLTLWFIAEPSEDDKAAVELYWESVHADSEEATSYQTAAQKATAEAANKTAKVSSATAKLLALGLSADEVKAILG